MIDDFRAPKSDNEKRGREAMNTQTNYSPTHPPQQETARSQKLTQRLKRNFRREGWRSALTTVAVLIMAPLFALLLTVYVFQTYQVEGPSMEPTLHPSDRLIVWKMPRTWARITGNAYIPSRGDIIIFTEPKLAQFGQESSKQLIKRVVALPGERIAIHEGVVTVYNDQYPRGFQPDKELDYGESIGTTPGELDTVVPEDHVFVLGDNRANSLDSPDFGPVHTDNVIGDLAARVLPLDQTQSF